MVLRIASFCAVESVHGDYGVAANKLKQKEQENTTQVKHTQLY